MNGWHDHLRGPASTVTGGANGFRLIGQYLTDLTVSIGIVLIVGWIFQEASGDSYVQDALITQSAVYVALGQFTPMNVLGHYAAMIEETRQNLNAGFATGGGLTVAAGQTFVTMGWLLADIFLAAPRTLIELYRQTSGLAAWVVLGGFTASFGGILGWLLSGRFSLWRLVLASAASPLVVSVVFLALQGFMVLLLSTFFRLTVLAPYAVACPVLCTLYWIVFRHADHGATSSVARAIGNLLHGQG